MSQQNMSASASASSGFEGVKVSKGFVRGLQSQILKLERNQQSLIAQLEHANALATEFHETSVMYQRKYDQALYQMEEMTRIHENEKAMMNFEIQHLNEEAAYEREMNQVNSEQITMLERQLAQQTFDMTQMQTIETMETMETMQSQATTVANTGVDGRDDSDQDQDREELSPVSVSSPTPRTPMTPRARAQTPTLDPETPRYEDEEEDEYEKDPAAYWQREYPKWTREYHEDKQTQGAQEAIATYHGEH